MSFIDIPEVRAAAITVALALLAYIANRLRIESQNQSDRRKVEAAELELRTKQVEHYTASAESNRAELTTLKLDFSDLKKFSDGEFQKRDLEILRLKGVSEELTRKSQQQAEADKTEIAKLNEIILKLQSDIDKLHATIATLQADIKKLHTTIAELQTQNTELAQQRKTYERAEKRDPANEPPALPPIANEPAA